MVVVYDIPKVISATIVRFAHAHGVVGEVNITVVAFGGSAWWNFGKSNTYRRVKTS